MERLDARQPAARATRNAPVSDMQQQLLLLLLSWLGAVQGPRQDLDKTAHILAVVLQGHGRPAEAPAESLKVLSARAWDKTQVVELFEDRRAWGSCTWPRFRGLPRRVFAEKLDKADNVVAELLRDDLCPVAVIAAHGPEQRMVLVLEKLLPEVLSKRGVAGGGRGKRVSWGGGSVGLGAGRWRRRWSWRGSGRGVFASYRNDARGRTSLI